MIVNTNATNGYIVTVQQNQNLTSGSLDTINPFVGSYLVLMVWSGPPGLGVESYFGFTTDDVDYANFQSDKYGSFASDNHPYNVVVETGPVVGEINYISYQLEVTNMQESGIYSNDITYIATAIF